MDTVIVTVTVDCSMSYPGFPGMPPIDDVPTVAQEYIRSIDAGASLVHHHGVHHLEEGIQEDGRRLSRIDHAGWRDLTERIRAERDAIIQFGIASARVEEKIALMGLKPEMMSYAFNVHDEYFRPTRHCRRTSSTRSIPVPSSRPSAGRPRAGRQARDRVVLHRCLLEPGVHPCAGAARRAHLDHHLPRLARRSVDSPDTRLPAVPRAITCRQA